MPIIPNTSVLSPEEAAAELKRLVKEKGVLQVITAEHRCHGGRLLNGKPHDPATEKEQAECEAFAYTIHDPRHFVCHDVVKVEGPNEKGQFTASTAEGDWTMGQPAALLKRLLEATVISGKEPIP